MEAQRPRPRLSPKEREVLRLHRQGLSEEAIGQRMLLSVFAVRTFLENAKVKLDMGAADDEQDSP